MKVLTLFAKRKYKKIIKFDHNPIGKTRINFSLEKIGENWFQVAAQLSNTAKNKPLNKTYFISVILKSFFDLKLLSNALRMAFLGTFFPSGIKICATT